MCAWRWGRGGVGIKQRNLGKRKKKGATQCLCVGGREGDWGRQRGGGGGDETGL